MRRSDARRYRLGYRQPVAQGMSLEREIVRGIEVGVVAIATDITAEGETLANTKSAAARANLRAVARVNENHVDAALPGLVGNKRLQLGEGPGVLDQALLTLDSYALTDMRQVFQDNHISRLEAVYNTPTDRMIHPRHVAVLSPRQPAQQGPDAGSAARVGLERPPQASIPLAGGNGLRAAESQAIAGRSQVLDAQVYANDLPTTLWCGHGRGQDDMDVEGPLALVMTAAVGFCPLSKLRW
jgi:hypothetical protein